MAARQREPYRYSMCCLRTFCILLLYIFMLSQYVFYNIMHYACIRERAELALELLRHSDGQYLKINPNQNIPSKGCSDLKFFLENL